MSEEGKGQVIPVESGAVVDFSSEPGYDMTAFAVSSEEVVEPASNPNEQLDENDQPIVAEPKDNNDGDPSPEEQATALAEAEAARLEEERVAKKKEQSGKGGDDSSPNTYSSLAGVLSDQGIISSLDPDLEIKDANDLIKVMNTEIESRELADLNDTQKEYLTALRKGIPEQDVREYQSVTAQLDAITETEITENAELRVELIKLDFQDKGFTEERATKMAQRSVDIGEDVADATEAHANLKQSSQVAFDASLAKADQDKLDATKKHQDTLKGIKKEITSRSEIIPSMKLSAGVKDKLYDQMTKPVGTVDGRPINAVQKKRSEDPVDFEIKLNYLFHMTDGFTNFSKLVTKAKTEAIKNLDNALKGDGFGAGRSGNVDPNISNPPAEGNDFTNMGELA